MSSEYTSLNLFSDFTNWFNNALDANTMRQNQHEMYSAMHDISAAVDDQTMTLMDMYQRSPSTHPAFDIHYSIGSGGGKLIDIPESTHKVGLWSSIVAVIVCLLTHSLWGVAIGLGLYILLRCLEAGNESSRCI